MENIIEMFRELPVLMQVFWGCAIISSLFMLVQLILSLVGIGDNEVHLDSSVEGLDASSGMDLFTVKNITNFFVGFGWGGISFASTIEVSWQLVLAAIACGCLFVCLFILLFKQLMKIESNSAVGADACVGLTADVYLRVPAARKGKGIIQLSLGGAIREFGAMTDAMSDIPTGCTVKVVELIGEDVLLVSKL